MTSERETLRLVGEWLAEGRTGLPDHVLDAVLEQIPAKPQRRPRWPSPRIPDVTSFARYLVAAAAAVAIAIVGVNVLQVPGQLGRGGPAPGVASPSPSSTPLPSPSPSPSPSAVGDLPTPSAGQLPARSLPGTRASPAGEYGWEGGPRDRAWMHKVDEGGERVALVFAVRPDCFVERDGQEAVPVRVAGFDGLAIEPYQPPVPFGSADGDEVTRAHALAVGDRTLCVFLTWHPTTTDEELEAAEGVLATLRAVPMGEDRIRITFTLDEGWDTG